ncbi:MAG: pyruvate kinase [Gammaproteobacteria bacterium]|nr:pyruvate kinase [Gammaproteobacteria bacterium]
MRRHRNAKIIATLGPATSSPDAIRDLFVAGADVFRLNLSHGTHDDHAERVKAIRSLEQQTGRPIAVLLDLQGPKLRVGDIRNGRATLKEGAQFMLDGKEEPGDEVRAPLPHPEIFAALRPGTNLLIDDGRIRLEVKQCGGNFAETIVKTGGVISDHKGVNVPGVVLPLSPFTRKDKEDLAFGLEVGVDWIAASFIQRREDLVELRAMVEGRAAIMSKLEKPAAIKQLEHIVDLSDSVMVARGDLGVEMPPEQVPSIQKQIVRVCREAGKPVVVATQMLESMINTPLPTRAEASDVAGAIYDGADAVMLSAETATGNYPVEAVAMMNRIIVEVEKDPHYRALTDARLPKPTPTTADAICDALRSIADTLSIAAIVTYTSSGFSAIRAARERPHAPILSLTPKIGTARMLSLAWGIHSVLSEDVERVQEMVDRACEISLKEGFADVDQKIVIVAGMPFGVSGTTNMIRIAEVVRPRAET